MNNTFPVIPEDMPGQAAQDIGRTLVFDFARNAFVLTDGKIAECSGTEAVKQWIMLVLRQVPDKTPIYRIEGQKKIGIDRSVLGMRAPNGFAASEIERTVRDTLSFCPAIAQIGTVTVSRSGRSYLVTVSVYLHSGENVEVTDNVQYSR